MLLLIQQAAKNSADKGGAFPLFLRTNDAGVPAFDKRTGSLFSYVDFEDRVPGKHPLPVIRCIVNDVLSALDGEFAKYLLGTRRAGSGGCAFLNRTSEPQRGTRLLSDEHYGRSSRGVGTNFSGLLMAVQILLAGLAILWVFLEAMTSEAGRDHAPRNR